MDREQDFAGMDNDIEWEEVTSEPEEKKADYIHQDNDIEWEDVNIPSYTTLDVDTNEVYSVPATMDDIDARFAIDTQTKNENKADYFGKNKMIDESWLNDAARMSSAIGEATQDVFNSANRGVLGFAQQMTDTFLHAAYHVPEKTKMLQEAENGDFSRWGKNLSEERKAEILEERKRKLEWVKNVREKNRSFWENGRKILRPDEKMDDMDRLLEGVGNAIPSVATSVGVTMATKNPYAGAAVMAGMFGRMRYTEVFDKATEKGFDYEDADLYASAAGTIEGGIELIFEPLLLKVGKIGRFSTISDSIVAQTVGKLMKNKTGSAAVKKIATKNTSSVWAASFKGFAIEGGEEGSQQAAGMMFENWADLDNYSSDDIVNETLFATAVGGITGFGTAGIGTTAFNREVKRQNVLIKDNLIKQYPELNDGEAQIVADGLQDILYQNSEKYMDELDNLLAKENDPDTLVEGIDAKNVTENTRKILKDRYQMSDDEIEKTIKTVLPIIDARNQFNDVYQSFYDQMTQGGVDNIKADAGARLFAARATSLAFAEGVATADIVNRWKLRFDIEGFSPAEMRIKADDIERLKKGVSTDKSQGLSLSQFIAKKLGGINDDRGDIKSMGSVPGVLSKNGISLDEATFQAWEAGYIVANERPEVNQLLDLLSDDLNNRKVYSQLEKADDDLAYYEGLQHELDIAGVDIFKDSLPDINKKLNEYYNRQKQFETETEKTLLSEDEQERLALMLEGGVSETEAVKQIVDSRTKVQDDDLYFQADILSNKNGVEIAINSSEEMQGLSEDDFKNKMIDTLKSFKGQKIYNSSLKADIEIRASSIKKYKSFFADKNKRLIVPYIPELLQKANFNKIEDTYTKRETSIKAYYKANLPMKIDNNVYDANITVREDSYGNFFWDAQVKEKLQKTTPATNPGGLELKADKSTYDDSISLEVKNVNDTLYQNYVQDDLFSFSNNGATFSLKAKKEMNDLFSWAKESGNAKGETEIFFRPEDINKKIEDDYKNNDNEIVDTGDSLLGNLKRNKKEYSWSELEDMNDLLRKKYISKQYIISKPDFVELKSGGMSDRAAAFVINIYNKISAKPAKGYAEKLEGQRIYFNFIREVMEKAVNFARVNDSIISNYSLYDKANKDLFNDIFSDVENKKGYNIFRDYPEYNRKAITAGGNKLLNSLELDRYSLKEIDDIIKQSNIDPSPKETVKKNVWDKYFQVLKNYDGTYFVGDSKSGRVFSRDLKFETEDKAVEFANKLYEKMLPFINKNVNVVDFSNMRDALPRRKDGQNVNPQALIDTFGFRGINFGNWTKQSERQDFINLAYDSLFDLSEILNLPPKAMGFDGQLGIAFGAQGRSGAAGHFIPEYNEINLTRKQGAGSLAHEWWHALDYYFGDLSEGKLFGGKALLGLDVKGNLRPEIFESMKNLREVIKNSPMTEDELFARKENLTKSIKNRIEYRGKEVKSLFVRSKNHEKADYFVDDIIKNADAYNKIEDNEELNSQFISMLDDRRRTFDNISKFSMLLWELGKLKKIDEISNDWKKESEYYKNAKRLNEIEKGHGVAYWTSDTELGARAFASYILDKISKKDWINNFLVRDEKGEEYLDIEAMFRAGNIVKEENIKLSFNDFLIPSYPKNIEERKRIFAAFDDFFKTIKYEETEKGYRLYQDRKKAPRGYYQRKDSGEAIIKLFQSADASTIVHEAAHFFLDDMRKFADNAQTAAQLEAIYNYVGSKDGNMSVEQHEYFARSFEAYLMNGRSPNNLLRKVFVRFRNWLKDLYTEIKNLEVELTPEIIKTFDDMLGGRRIDFAMQQTGEKMLEALESGTISTQSVNKAIDLLRQGKMSKADMEDLISRLKSGELKRADFAKELKKFEESNNSHSEIKNNFDYLKYRGQLERGNFSKKDVKAKIEKLLEWTKPRTNGGKLVGRFPDIVINREFDNIRKIFELDRQSALQKINENADIIEKIVKGELSGDIAPLVWENKVLSVSTNRASAKMLIEVYNAISDSYNSGKLTTAVTGEAKRARRDRLIKDTVEVLSYGKGENWRQESSKIKKTIRTTGSSMQGWNGILDMLSMFDGTSQTGKSKISKNLNVFSEEIKMREGVADDGERLLGLLEKSLKGNGVSVNRYINEHLTKEYVIEWGINKRTFTKDKLIDIYMKAKDPETREIMVNDEINQFDEVFLAKVDELLSSDDLAVASAFFNFYDETYQKLNDFYEEHYGVSLGKRQYYSPRSMDKGGIDVTTGDLRSYAGLSATKVRTAKSGPVDIKGAFYVLQNYIANSNHYIAFADKLQDINAVLGDVEVRNRIRSLFGEDLNKKIAREVSRFATNDKVFTLGKMAGWASTIRSNYAVSVLALKPSLTIKQLTSFPAYWENMTTAEFLSGLADFAKHPKQCMEILANTTYMKTRGTNIIKDFEIMSNKEAFKNLGNKIGFREFLMKNIQIGDRGAIYLGGWAVYKNVLEKTGSKKMAEAEFARITNETQQSSYMSEQNTWQSNPFGAAFTMFQTSQNQYFRKELNAIRGLITGRMPKSQVAKAIFIYHFLLPMFFQAVADGFRWDDKAQFRAAVLGSLNGVFVLGEVLERAVDWAMTGALKTRTAVRDLVPYWASGEDLLAEIAKIDIDDISVEDFIESLKRLGKPTGELLGLPIKYGIDIASNLSEYIDDEDYSKAFLLTLGWSPYALRDLD